MSGVAPPVAPPARAALAAGGRLHFLDGLRGIAAMAVVCFHIYRMTPLYEPLRTIFPLPLHLYAAYGGMGVLIFFVLSGFVIPYSVRNSHINWPFVGRFLLRRSIRLDPAYWVTIVVAVAVRLALHFGGNDPTPLPTLGQVASHFVYLQGILDYPQIVSVFWTLCIEIQLYGVLLALLAISQRAGSEGRGDPRILKSLPFIIVLAISFVMMARGSEDGRFFIDYWYMFFFGTVTFWTLDHRLPRACWWLMALTILTNAIVRQSIDCTMVLATGSVIYLAGRTGQMRRWLNFGWLQYLGRISYSLYLTHFLGANLAKVLSRISGPGPAISLVWFAVSITFSILIAHLMYRWIELPTMRLAKNGDPVNTLRQLFGRRHVVAPADAAAETASGV